MSRTTGLAILYRQDRRPTMTAHWPAREARRADAPPLTLRPTLCPRRFVGFTLLEVLIALAILAILMTGLIKIAGQNTQNLWYLENSLLAEQIAHNRLLALRLSGERPEHDDGWETMAGRRWFWQIDRQRASMLRDVPAYRVKVFREGEISPYIDLLSFLPHAV